MPKHYLAVDLGSSNGKVTLAELSGGKLEMREVGRFATPKIWMHDHICINIYEMYGQVCKILEQLGRNGMEIESIGVDSWASDFGIVDSEGNLIGLPVFYRDRRTNGMTEEIEKVISYEALYPLTTQRKMQDSTLSQLVAAGMEEPELLHRGKMMHIGDLMMYFFTGRVCSEISVASYSQMFSMEKGCWEDQVFDLFHLPKTLQPEVVQAGEYLGKISERHARSLHVNQFSIIAPAVHDTASACTAVPAREGENWACIATGSWYLVSMELDSPADKKRSYTYNLSNTGLSFGKTLLKRNVCAMWLIQECKRVWERMGISCEYSEIAEKAKKAIPFYAFIDTDSVDFYNPEDMADSIIRYLQRTKQSPVQKDDIGQIARIVYESIAFKCFYSLEALKKTTGKPVDVLYVVGGTSGVDFLNQMLASVTNTKIVSGPKEATAVGNTLLQAVGTTEVSDIHMLREVVRNTFPEKVYIPADHAQWQAHYSEYLQICGLDRV